MSRVLAILTTVTAGLAAARPVDPAEFFEKKIRPVLAASCAACHNQKVKTAGLDLSSGEGFWQGGQSGPLIDKDKPEESRLLKVVSYDERLKMPPTGKLSATRLADLADWAKMGAPWPGSNAPSAKPTSAIRKGGRNFSDAERKFWSFQPVTRPQPPQVTDNSWVRSDIDRFVLSKLEAKGLRPAPEADKTTLLRRATFDLTGLPPTEKELADFLADNSPAAFRSVVERLLASPRYGERWGRHWLDVARYADSTGNDEDHRYPYAWRYRDYVIQSFNADVPYDRFIREQIAGDLMPSADGGINTRGIVATGFLALGAKAVAQQDKKKMLYDVYDEQVDVTSKAILGLTLSCSRCHDHKFDPLLSRDYYSMIGFFANTRNFKDSESHVSKLLYVPLVPPEVYKKYSDHQEALSNKKFEMEDVIEQEKQRYTAALTPRLGDYMLAAWDVKRNSVAVADAAASKALQAGILAKWVEYLRQDSRQKPHLEEWSKATGATVGAVAAKYQQGYSERMDKWSKKIGEWLENTRRALKEMNMPPRPRPEFAAEEDGFFYDIYIDGKGPFGVGKNDQEKIYSAQAKQTLARLKQEEDALKRTAPSEPDMACGVADGDPVAQKVFIRGDYNASGEDAPKAFPLILAKAGDPVPGPKGSGRLELAQWLSSAANPLTPRVMANRVWQRHFSEGIVRTPDNFGKMGERPTHPELLDWLAAEFIAKGWSIKEMHRTIMNSSTYRMASSASREILEKDPENRLLSRFQRRRLDVEEIRDGLLAIDGSLDTSMGGTLQSGFGTDGENSQDRLSINPEKHKRRTVYLPLRRANLPTLLNLFDFGDATTPMGKRSATNVAPQALFMMNSEFLTERSSALAGQLLADPAASQASRVERAYIRTVNRKPEAREIDAALSYLSAYRQRFAAASDKDAFQSLCRVLMASSDFIYVD